jgi:hypothetical protein
LFLESLMLLKLEIATKGHAYTQQEKQAREDMFLRCVRLAETHLSF